MNDKEFLKKLDEERDYILKNYSNDNWDEDGARAIKKVTIDRVIEILVELNKEFYKIYGKQVDLPIIDVGDEGELYLVWKLSPFNLSVKINEIIDEKKDNDSSYFIFSAKVKHDNRLDVRFKAKGKLQFRDLIDTFLFIYKLSLK